jgi:hypothetical protein
MELVPQLDGYLVDLKFIEHALICFTDPNPGNLI